MYHNPRIPRNKYNYNARNYYGMYVLWKEHGSNS